MLTLSIRAPFQGVLDCLSPLARTWNIISFLRIEFGRKALKHRRRARGGTFPLRDSEWETTPVTLVSEGFERRALRSTSELWESEQHRWGTVKITSISKMVRNAIYMNSEIKRCPLKKQRPPEMSSGLTSRCHSQEKQIHVFAVEKHL